MKKILLNIKKIWPQLLLVLLFVVSRLPDLGHDTFNTDVWKWKSRSYDFGSGIFTLNFDKTFQKYHPGVTLMWSNAVAVKTYNFYYDVVYKTSPDDDNFKNVFEINFIQKLFISVIIGLTLASVFTALKNIISTKYAVVAVVLLAIEPFYIALSREIHLEGLMSTFMLASVVWLYYYLQTDKRFHFVLAAVFAGLAFLTKTSALFLLPFIGLTMFLKEFSLSRNFLRAVLASLKKFGIWVLISLVTFVLFWPYMWVHPINALVEMYRGIFVIGVETEHEQFFFGKLVSDPGPLFYFLVIAFRTSIYLLPGLVGYLLLVFRKQAKREKSFAIYMLLYALLYLLEMIVPTKKLDRYILPSIMALSLVSSFFFIFAFDKICELISKYLKGSLQYLGTGVVALLMLAPLGIVDATVHPDYFSYYNPLFGGIGQGIKILEPKWMIGVPETVAFFKDLKQKENLIDADPDTSFEEIMYKKRTQTMLTVAFPEKYYTQIWPFFKEMKAWAIIENLTPFAVKTKFFVFPVWDDTSMTKKRDYKLEFVDSIKVRGVPVYNVYRRV